jgi:hypothetical protein
MSLWSKIDNFFSPKPAQEKGAAAAAAAAADIILYLKDLITRPERAVDLFRQIKNFEKLPTQKQAQELIPLYLDMETYIIKNEPIRKYTKTELRLMVYSALDLKNSNIPFSSFFMPQVEGALIFIQELLSKLADPAFETLGKNMVGQIIITQCDNTIFEGVNYSNGVLDFSSIQTRIKNSNPSTEEFIIVFNKLSNAIVAPVIELKGKTPDVYLLRKKIINNWQLLQPSNKQAWKEQKTVIPITAQARDIFTQIGMDELITKGVIEGFETEMVPIKGNPKQVNVSASALKDEDGNITGMVISAKDLTEIRNLEQDRLFVLETAKEQAEGMVRERTADLEALHKELQEKLTDMERFNKLAVGRELKMIQLKKELKRQEEQTSLAK